MKNFPVKNYFTGYALITTLVLALTGCEKESPTISTVAVTNINVTSAVSGGNIMDEGDAAVTARGLIWGEEDPTLESNDGLASAGAGEGLFPVDITGLLPYTEYIVKAFATNKYGTSYGNEQKFRTLPDWAGVITLNAIDISSKSATIRGDITDDGGVGVTERGFYYGILNDPELTGNKVTAGSGTGSFSASLTDILLPGTNYFVKAYALNLKGQKLGNLTVFGTLPAIPVLTTADPSDILTTSAKSGGTISSSGGLSILEKGIYYGINDNPQTTGYKVYSGTGPDAFTLPINNLSLGTKYYVVAFARNSLGTGYGAVKSFTTQSTKPVVVTGTPSGITTESATLGGNVTISGGQSVTDRGIYFGTSADPELTGSRVAAGTGTGTFSTVLSELASDATYYVKAYAVNSLGESLGSAVSFRTKPKTAPVIVTTPPFNITPDGATAGGNVIADGGSPVTDKGIYWGTSSNPETTGTKLSAGSGPGSFTVDLTGLETGNTYYIKAYAVNTTGQGLGSVVAFNTNGPGMSGDKIFNTDLIYGTVSDIEGNSYKTLVIGTQTWMAENLKTATYNDGASIPFISGNSEWISMTTSAYCWYDNIAANKDLTGGKYNWWVASSGKACPTGWNVPSDQEWTVLTNFLGGLTVAGGKLKETGLTHWNSPNEGATNSSGFTSLPGGQRYTCDGGCPAGISNGSFVGMGEYDVWWSSTEYNEIKAWYRSNSATNIQIFQSSGSLKTKGFSIRCVKD